MMRLRSYDLSIGSELTWHWGDECEAAENGVSEGMTALRILGDKASELGESWTANLGTVAN